MHQKMTLETGLCIGLICLGAFAFLTVGLAEDSASPFLLRQERNMGTLDYQTLPKLSALALIVLSVANIALLRYKNRNNAPPVPEKCTDANRGQLQTVRWRTAGTTVVLLVYTLLLPHVPFLLSTLLFLGIMFRVYGLQDWKKIIYISSAGAGFFWLVFVYFSSLAL